MASNTGVLSVNAEGIVISFDEQAARLLGLSSDDMQGLNLSGVLRLDGYASLQEYLSIYARAREALARLRVAEAEVQGRRLQVAVWDDADIFKVCLSEAMVMSPLLMDDRALLSAINELQQLYVTRESAYVLFSRALDVLLGITGSEYGFIGEIRYSAEGRPFLKTHAITNISWNAETEAFYKENAPSGMEFHNHDTLFGFTVAHALPVISNDVAGDPRATGRPAGHPPLWRYLGVPIFIGEIFVGMVGLANRPGGYSQSLVDYLEPLLLTYGSLMLAYRTECERQFAEEALQEKVVALEQANTSKSRFLASMSHELRTPLNSVLGFSKRLLHGSSSRLDEREQEALRAIQRNGEHLLQVINDVLDLSRIDVNRMNVAIVPCEVSHLLLEAKAQCEGFALARQVMVQLASMPAMWVSADRQRMVQVLVNLISNGIKYGGGRVWLSAEPSSHDALGEVVVLSVQDNGKGIAESDQRKLFRKFTQLGGEDERIGSSGLGLALVAELSRLQGCEVELQSEPGRGAVFRVFVPRVLEA